MIFPESQMSLLEAESSSAGFKNGTEMLPESQTSPLETESCWLGLATDNRRLFDAFQDGWLRPMPSDGQVVGIRSYARDKILDDSGHPIPVRVKFDVTKLPEFNIHVLRDKCWQLSYIKNLEPRDHALYWPSALPTFAISELLVSTEEERARFTGMAKFTSNVVIREELVKVGTVIKDCFDVDISPPKKAVGISIPKNLDAIHGAIAMAVWGIPRIDPWLDILTASLDLEQSSLEELTGKVDASWWQFPPWMKGLDNAMPNNLQDSLWLSATKVFRDYKNFGRINPQLLSKQIHDAVLQIYPAEGQYNEASKWLERTTGILRAESIITLQIWQNCPVGTAIQLVLNRPEPTNFRTWFDDMPELPPAIAWSAAVLCGLLHGYRNLDCQFRGTQLQSEILSIHALRLAASANGLPDVYWPSVTANKPEWRRTANRIVLSWNDNDFSTKTEKARGQWFSADFSDTFIRDEAQKLATKLNWPCVTQDIILKDVQIPYSGLGTIYTTIQDSSLKVVGEVRIPLPENVKTEKKLNIDRFRYLISTEAGQPPKPPFSLSESEAQIHQPEIPGLKYIPDFLSTEEEEELVKIIDSHPWNTDLRRRVQHYGWRYDYKARRVDPSMFLGYLPEWAGKLARRLASEGLVPQLPDQLIVNEYTAEQGISSHIDSDSFADGVAMISLLESWGMVFRKKRKKNKIEKLLERRSATILCGEARYDWKHEIPKRKSEICGPGKKRKDRNRRISLTFRKVNYSM